MIAGHQVTQRDTIPILSGAVTVRFISTRQESVMQGIQLYAGKGGKIELSDESATERLDIWRQQDLPDVVSHLVFCPKGSLSVSNRYEIKLHDGRTIAEHWTGNAGMTLLHAEKKRRRYGCSNGIGAFCPVDIVFEIEWEEFT